MLVLLCTTVLGSGFGSSAMAQSQQGTASTAAFDIPPQPLSQALVRFSKDTGLQLFYGASIARGINSPGVQGTLSRSAALTRLLAGSGLTYRFNNANTVTIQKPGDAVAGAAPAGSIPLDTIDVQGAGNPLSTMTPMPAYAGGQVATGGQVGMLGNRSVMDTPFNQTSYTAQTIQDQQARTVADVLANDPSVTLPYAPSSGLAGANIRGFTAPAPSVNGVYGASDISTLAPAGFIERVEVLKGPGALLSGMPVGGAIGGSVNLVTKRAADEPLTQFTTTYISRGQVGEHVDVGRRFGQDNAFGVRFNGTYSGGEAVWKGGKQRLGDAVLGLDYRSDRLRLSADLGYQYIKADCTEGTPVVVPSTLASIPSPLNAGKCFQPPWQYQEQTNRFGLIQAEYDLTNNVTAYAAFGLSSKVWDQNQVTQQFKDIYGNMSTFGGRSIDTYNNTVAQVGLRGLFDTGFINHSLSINASRNENTWLTQASTNTYSASPNIYNPIYSPEPIFIMGSRAKGSYTTLSSVGIADTLSILDKRVQLTVGVRRQQVGVDSYSYWLDSDPLATSYRSSAWSPAYALVIKPWNNVSLYANYIQGLTQGTVVGSTYANAGAVIPPYVSKQYETGVKVDWGRLTTTISVFQITQPQLITIAGSPKSTQAADGEQRNRGLEIMNFGELTTGVRLLGGLTLFEARQIETTNHLTDGKVAIGVPKAQLNFGAEWDTPFVHGLTLNGRVAYTTSQFVNTTNTLSIPDWTRLDLGARYMFMGPLNKPVTIRFDVRNVFNKNYWGYVYAGSVSLAEPRTFLLSTTMNF